MRSVSVGTTPPSVVIDASALTSVAAKSGIGTYTRRLLEALAERDDVAVTALVAGDGPLPPGVDRLRVHRRAGRPRAEVIEHAARLPLDLRRRRPSGAVFHNPGFHAPAAVGPPWVQTLHDLIPLVLDHPDLQGLKQRWKRFGPRYQRADAIIAGSRHAAEEGIRLLGIDPRRVTVAPHGVSAAFGPSDDWPSDPPYLLVVSEYSRRKGFDCAFAVADELADLGYPHRLVVAGRIHDWGREELERLRATSRHPERIEILGFVPDIVALYQGASVFLMTSRYEGFGLPALEAMACGIPVVAFDNSAVSELVSGGGVLVADGDVVAMTAATRTVVDNPAAGLELRQRGLERAGTFTWQASAGVHAGVYRDVAERAAR
jgi:glycosyltransferase involved in cell wall biosynthesis